jgi:hypothetical protein
MTLRLSSEIRQQGYQTLASTQLKTSGLPSALSTSLVGCSERPELPAEQGSSIPCAREPRRGKQLPLAGARDRDAAFSGAMRKQTESELGTAGPFLGRRPDRRA